MPKMAKKPVKPPKPSNKPTSSPSSTKNTPSNKKPTNNPKNKGPAPTPKNPGTTTPAAPTTSPEELKQQQALLDIFQHTFQDVLSQPQDSLSAQLQEVKQALYRRDFEQAFGRAENLEVYAARWSPTRALCYSRVLDDIKGYLVGCLLAGSVTTQASGDADDSGNGEHGGGNGGSGASPAPLSLRILSIGGGAAEIAAAASLINTLSPEDAKIQGTINLLDMGPWQAVIQKLHTSLTSAPQLSKYASAAAKATAKPMVESSRFDARFTQQDVLSLDSEQVVVAVKGTGSGSGSDANAALLVTLLFTLNELYTCGGIGKTTTFLRVLTACIPANSLLLVVDSPGSYSETAVGKEARKYPMHWLLDHTLLQGDKQVSIDETGSGCRWEKLESHDSVWFRLGEDLRYPIPLENMRYQMHLYRAVPRGTD